MCVYVLMHLCLYSVGVPHEPQASHKIQLWKTRDLYSQLTTATHKHLQGSEPSVVTDCSISYSVLLDVNHWLLCVCACVCACVFERDTFWEHMQLVAGNVACLSKNVSQHKFFALSLWYIAEITDYCLHHMENIGFMKLCRKWETKSCPKKNRGTMDAMGKN